MNAPPAANFPASIWDGLSGERVNFTDKLDPNGDDYWRMRAELLAIANHLISLLDSNKNVLMTPLVTKGTDPSYITIADLWKFTTKDIVLPIGGSAVASVSLAYTIPAGSLVFGAAMNIESTITLATATKIGLGVAGSLAKYGSITGGTKNNKSTVAITPTALASGDALSVYATDNSNAAAGTIQNGSVRVRLLLGTQSALPDAA